MTRPGIVRLAPALGYGALALLLVVPVLSDPTRWAIGHPETDTYNHLWGYWHVGQALAEGRSPFQVTGLSWPHGGTLYFIDLFGALLTLPVAALFGPVAAYNTAIVANIAFSGLAARALGLRVGLGAAGAAFAGLAYATCPHVLGQIYDGISETAATGWLPLALLAAIHWRADPRPRTGAAAGLALAAATAATFYYGLFASLAVAAVIAEALLRQPRLALRPLAWRSGLAFAAAWASLVVPMLWVFRQTLSAPDALVTREEGFVALTLVGHNMTDLWSFFRPGRTYSPDLKALFDEGLIVVVYAGWTLLLAAVGLAWARRGPLSRGPPSRGPPSWSPGVRPWVAGALVSFVLALGPYLYVGGRWPELPGLGHTPLPFLAFFVSFPGFSRISHAFRFAVPLGLCLAMLAGAWVASRRRPTRAAVVLSGIWVAELVFASPAVLPLPVSDTRAPAVYARVAELAPSGGAVLDLPISLQVLARSRYSWWQAQHGLGIPYGLNDPTPKALLDNRLGRMIVDVERSSLDTLSPELPTLDLVLGGQMLAAQGYRAIVVHRDLYPPTVRERVLTLLEIAVGPGETVESNTLFPLAGQALARGDTLPP